MLNCSCMRTTIEIDDQLMVKSRQLTNIKTKRILVDNALRLYVTVDNQRQLLALWGKIELDEEAYK